MNKRIKWKVQSPPTGRCRSFIERGWPDAVYIGTENKPAASITCKDDYSYSKIKTGNHSPLRVLIADYRTVNWTWRRMKGEFRTLVEAKEAAERLIEAHPEIRPK